MGPNYEMIVWTLLWFMTIFGPSTSSLIPNRTDPDERITTEQMIRSRGFNFEKHRVLTDDGYILTLERVIHPWVNRSHLRPVIIQHGIMGNGINWLMASPYLYPKQSEASDSLTLDPNVYGDYLGDNLGFDLALTERYDVWLANSRGSMTDGKPQHRRLSVDNPKFWAFSWDEMGRYDLPAIIDYVLNETRRETVSFVGHSQGTTSLFVMLSMVPEYADKVQPAIALAPVTYIKHMGTPLRDLLPVLTEFCLHDGQFIATEAINRYLLELLCPLDIAGVVCPDLFFLISGFDHHHMNESRMPVYGSYLPAPSSIRQVCHFYQNYRSGRFARFDYGSDEANWAHYSSDSPPDYPLESITSSANIAFYMGYNDYFSNYKDLESLKTGLARSGANIIKTYKVSDPIWAHLDFVIGSNAGNLFIKDMIDVLDQYSKDK